MLRVIVPRHVEHDVPQQLNAALPHALQSSVSITDARRRLRDGNLQCTLVIRFGAQDLHQRLERAGAVNCFTQLEVAGQLQGGQARVSGVSWHRSLEKRV